MSTRRRISLVLAALIAFGFAGLIPWLMSGMRPRYLMTIEETLVDMANVCAAMLEDLKPLNSENVAERLRGIDRDDVGAHIYHLDKDMVDAWIVVTDAEGLVLHHSRDSTAIGDDWSQWRDIKRTLAGTYGARTTWMDLGSGEEEILHISAPIGPREKPRGVLTVCKGSGSAHLIIDQTRRGFLAMAALVGGAVLLVGLAATWWITKPITRLTAHVEALQAGERRPMPPLGPHDLAALGRAFEGMRDALDGKAYVESYVQTLTHEMKAPVAGIRAAAELLDEDLPPDDRHRFLANLRGESARLQDLLDRALALASIERRRSLDQPQSIRIADLLAEAVEALAARAQRAGVTVTLAVADAPRLDGERFLLRQAVDNLLGNAIDFAPTGSTVHVWAGRVNDRCCIRIRDHGPGIPAYAEDRIFDRFYSLPRPGSGRKSTGLGLPFVREVMQLHGGTVAVANHLDGGVEAVLTI